MNAQAAIEAALRGVGVTASVASRRSLAGGCIYQVEKIALSDGKAVVAKLSSASDRNVFEEEAAGLRALAETDTVIVPRPLGVHADEHAAVLLMTWLEPGAADAPAWASFGEALARLHSVDVGSRYGFELDNHLGPTPQPNGWCDDWVEFNAEHRLGHQLRLARNSGHINASESRAVNGVIDQLERLIPRQPKPALLHGDLWSGNALPTVDANGMNTIAAIDPACSIGDGWADIAMMKLFGGFSSECFTAYAANVDDHDDVESRIAVYQLYHVLNHINIFGRGYVAQAMRCAERLIR